MTFTVSETNVRAIRQGDNGFMIYDGLVAYPRAMIHILPECPSALRDEINWAISQGYLKTVAHMTEKEIVFNGLSK